MKRAMFFVLMTLAGSMSLAGASASSSAPVFAPVLSSVKAPGGSGQGCCVLPQFGPGAAYHPAIDPSQFGPDVDNPWLPLKPGTTFVYAGTKDGKNAIDVFAVSRRTRTIDGVRTRIVNDRLYLNGVLEERTSDYYAQDRCGNVWYFGEDTATLDRLGKVLSREGSFHAGVKAAQPGVFMQAQPELGRSFRQEWSPGNAEDQFKLIAKNASVTVPFGTFHHALRTQETTALEPEVVDNKLYVRGIGEVQELAVKGPVERLSLVDVLR
jgi:hypothetical protein